MFAFLLFAICYCYIEVCMPDALSKALFVTMAASMPHPSLSLSIWSVPGNCPNSPNLLKLAANELYPLTGSYRLDLWRRCQILWFVLFANYTQLPVGLSCVRRCWCDRTLKSNQLLDIVKLFKVHHQPPAEHAMTTCNGEPSLFVDRQMALLCNSDIHSTGSSIVYMLIFDCLGN